MHFYEPKLGHGLKHDPFNAIVGPRPIGWISSLGKDGSVNLAPYSFFNAFNYVPPIIGFASTGAKDSLRNIEETGEFVWNLVTEEVFPKMNATSESFPYGTNEFEKAGLTQVASKIVKPPRVGESLVHFECKKTQILRLQDHQHREVDTWLVLGEVVGVHVNPICLKEGIFDTFSLGIMLRAGGPSAYAKISPETRHDLSRPGARR